MQKNEKFEIFASFNKKSDFWNGIAISFNFFLSCTQHFKNCKIENREKAL